MWSGSDLDGVSRFGRIVAASLAVFVLAVGVFIGYTAQFVFTPMRTFEDGVKAHARGEYVVVQMPDGTEQVCKVKEAPDAK